MNASENKHLLRIEGVNLSNVLDDTSEISIRRGSGLMLRQAVTEISKRFPDLDNISTGASIGLYAITATNNSAENIQQTVVEQLNADYPYLSFVVDIEPYQDEGFKQAHEKVIAKNRYRQFQQITLVTPKPVEGASACCDMNHLHPVDKNPEKIKTNKQVSASSRERFKQGRELRQKFYQQELNLPNSSDYKFTNDLTELSKPTNHTQNFNNLNDKMAVIYLDGNGFGKIQNSCLTKESLQSFDQTNQDYRRDFLKDLINKLNNDPDMKNGDNIRLETLLWGGDEMILVVPAWKGISVIQSFYDYSKDWHYTDKNNQKDHALTYAGGIVFCQHKTPIAQVIRAAKDLAETVKERKEGRSNNYFDYLVLESIDYPTQAIKEYWALRYGASTQTHRPALCPKSFSHDLAKTLEGLPRGSIYDIGQHWVEHWKSTDPQNSKKLESRISRFKEVDSAVYHLLFDQIFPLLTETLPNDEIDQQHKNPAWLHLVELWDYLAPVNVQQ